MKKFIPAVGESDFRSLRIAKYDFVDKSFFISDVLADSSKVLLFPRPRRFGKTTNLSMLGHFLRKSNEDLTWLFDGLVVTRDANAMAHFQKHPVVSVSFKDVKAETFADAMADIREQIVMAYDEHRHLFDENKLDPTSATNFRRVLSREVTDAELQHSFKWLSHALYKYHKERVVILIDEYDTPVQAAYAGKYFNKMARFFRNFFSACLKDNIALFKGVLTGILRVAKENMFSGLNHIDVHSIIEKPYSTCFGFTEDEVQAIVDPDRLGEVRAWYDGYNFGGHAIYNPWSILQFIKRGILDTYWVNTGSTELMEVLATKRGLGLSEKSTALLQGDTIEVPIDEGIVLRDIEQSPEIFWNFLLFAGYLKVVELRRHEGDVTAKLAIPNIEVRKVYRSMFEAWLRRIDPSWDFTDKFVRALLEGDAATAQEKLEHILLTAMSYQDPAGKEPEKLYHGFILGLLVHLEGTYDVRSNRESGYGRADVMLRPKGQGGAGVVLELKALSGKETVNAAMKAAAKQVRDRRYAADLVAAGATPVYEYAMVFDGKTASVKLVDDVFQEAAV